MRELVLPLLIAGLLPYVATGISKVGAFRVEDNARTRGWQNEMKDGWRLRAHWAQLNAFETFPFFAAAIAATMIFKPESPYVMPLAWGYIAFRLGYTGTAVAGWHVARSTMWLFAQICAGWLLVLCM